MTWPDAGETIHLLRRRRCAVRGAIPGPRGPLGESNHRLSSPERASQYASIMSAACSIVRSSDHARHLRFVLLTGQYGTAEMKGIMVLVLAVMTAPATNLRCWWRASFVTDISLEGVCNS